MKKRIRKRLLCVLLMLGCLMAPLTVSAENAEKEISPSMHQQAPDICPVASVWTPAHLSLPPSPTKASTALAREDLEGLMLCPGGMPFGVKFVTDGVTVVGFCDVQTKSGTVNPATDAGLRQKDVILALNGEALKSAADLTDRIEASGGKSLKLTCRRGGREFEATLKPAFCPAEGRYKTGIWVRDSGAGIGTVTFILPDTGAFAGLGHGICDADTGELIPMKRGNVSSVTISSVIKGAPGAPGELKGYFNTGKSGSLLGNSQCGVWGVFSHLPEGAGKAMPVGLRDDIKEGKATILCTLATNRMEEYDVKISNIKSDATGSKCFTVTVTDPDLIAAAGGIVQGMSGSPIIQNGKLVGAVTHVLIGDPTRGYGIFIENMLSAAQMPMARAS